VELLPVAGGDAALDALPALARALSGAGPALLPVPATEGVQPKSLGVLSPGEDDADDPTALVVSTSGSTGHPKEALLPISALAASAAATHERLGGPGTWLLALPAHHIAGLQVLLRSVAAGTSPQVMDLRNGFSPNGFAAATSELTSRPGAARSYTSLVPTQLTRLLDAGGAALTALASYDAVLVGGAATAPDTIRRARAAGVAVVTTYGMSETCGGCVYDGQPLSGVRWRTDASGRIELGGPVVARGYRGAPGHPAFTTDPDGVGWFRTDDAGEGGENGALRVLGRLDDVIVTGGLKVSPAVVEGALGSGQDGSAPVLLDLVQERVSERVAAYAAPRQLLLVEEIPLIGPGKPDRSALRAQAIRAGDA
jgi:O-succinylbenzoic acid--CoA ligase